MDFYNVNYWANQSGRYQVWNSVYPPMAFAVGHLITPLKCLTSSDSFQLRECAIINYWILVIPYLIAVLFLSFRVSRGKFGMSTTLVFFVMLMSTPSLYALERGNYIILAYAIFVCSIVVNNQFISAILLSAAVLLKPYLLVFLVWRIFRREIHYLASFLISLSIFYIASSYIVGEFALLQIVSNIFSFSAKRGLSIFESIYSATSIMAWVNVLQNEKLVLFKYYFLLKYLVFTSLAASIFTVIFAVYSLFLNFNRFSMNHFNLLIALLLLVTVDGLGQYAVLFLLPFLPVIPIIIRNISLFLKYLIFLVVALLLVPIDFPFGPSRPLSGISFLSGIPFEDGGSLTLLTLLRPILLVLLLFVLSYISLSGGVMTHRKLHRLSC